LRISQPLQGHRAASDAVFLQAALSPEPGDRVLDAGAGVGVAGLCLLARCPELSLTCVEIDPDLCSLARANAAENGVADHFSVIETDLTAPLKPLQAKGLAPETFDHVMANPPFHREGSVREAPDPGRAKAHVMGEAKLDAWLRFLSAMAKPKGTLTLIHKAEALPELLPLLDGRFGDVTVFPLFPKSGEPAARVIVQGRKGSRAPLRLLGGLVLHASDGSYTVAAEAILRHGARLDLGN
jgi:tRNA1(Val) A37 N6-methylase TrmN6